MIINKDITEIGYLSINHDHEELCGDHVQIVKPNDNLTIVVLADGLGSGVKANILSTLTSEIIATMMSNNLSIEECVTTIAETLPICKVRGVAYSTFTIVKIENNSHAEIYNYDNPVPFLLRDGRNYPISFSTLNIDDKIISHASIDLEEYDTIFIMSDGIIHAGIGEMLNFGWELPEIKDYVGSLYNKNYSSKSLATLLVNHVDDLYDHKPGDDATCAVVRIRERKQVNLMIGPASQKEDDKQMLSLFFSKEGKHIVCGGTTSHVVSKYLHEELMFGLDYEDKEIPPTASIKGVDLVTEGVITLNKVYQYSMNALSTNSDYFSWCYKMDGASQLARILFEEATDINFYVGCAINPAHQMEGIKIEFSTKMQIVDGLSKTLKEMGKKIKVSYF